MGFRKPMRSLYLTITTKLHIKSFEGPMRSSLARVFSPGSRHGITAVAGSLEARSE